MSSDGDGFVQRSYEIVATDPDDGDSRQSCTVESNESVLVPWPFDPLRSRERRRIAVRVAGGDGDYSPWSDPLDIEVGLLDPADWAALPVTAAFDGVAPQRPIRFRRTFAVDAGLTRARLYASAYGVYTVGCNGMTVGDDVLAPGWTVYGDRLRYQTYDLTDLLRAGDNVLGVTVAEGWYRGRLGFRGGRSGRLRRRHRPDRPARTALRGRSPRHGGDGRQLARRPRRAAGGEPLRRRGVRRPRSPTMAGRRPASTTARGRLPTVLASAATTMVAPTGPPVRRIETLRPVTIDRAPSGTTVVDFGQNITGRARISVRGEAGDEITLRHAEVLEHGELATWLLRTAAATDRYVLAGTGAEVYEPEFTIHGFRYVGVDGWPGALDVDAIEAVVCHSDMEPTGSFRCSDDRLNQLHENVRWSMRGNFVDVPTDCPQRDERLGWTGDIQVFAPAAAFLYDCCGLLTSWLADLAAEQRRFGTVPAYVPWVELLWPAMPAAAWGDAAVIVPWVLYERFGDVAVLRQQYDSMRAWVDQIATIAGDDHVWSEGFQFGDWLDPAAPPRDPGAARTDSALVATAYHAHTARLLARVASVLGHHTDAAHYDELARLVTAGFDAEFVTATGRLASDAQTAYALALQFDLLPSAAQRSRAAARLAELVRRDDYCIGTGFVGTPLVCDALVDSRVRRRCLPPPAADAVPLVAVSGDDGRDDRVGALGQPAAGWLDQPHGDDLVQPLRPRRHRRLPAPRRRRAWRPASPATARCSCAHGPVVG